MSIFHFSGDEHDDSYAAAPIPQRLKRATKVLIITGDNVQDLEFFYPYYRFTEEGYTVAVATPKGGELKGKKGMGVLHTVSVNDVVSDEYALLYLPGGAAPAELRTNDRVLDIVQEFVRANKPIASICHGAQILVSADVIEGKRIAAWPKISDEVRDAGATFVDEALVEDGIFVTARKPGDLPRHLAGTLRYLRKQEALNVDTTKPYVPRRLVKAH